MLSIDSSSKKLSYDDAFLQELGCEDKGSYEESLERVNELFRALVGHNSDVPPPGNQISGNLTQQVQKMKDGAVAALKNPSKGNGLKMLSMAIELSLRRPPWEAAQYAVEELKPLLLLRAEAYMGVNEWESAHKDVLMLTLISPLDAKVFYLRGKCQEKIEETAEAKQLFLAGLAIAPQDVKLKQALKDLSI